jgi:PTH1 family peptidyl-tRNA hydrolase
LARHTALGLIVGLGNPGTEYLRTRHNAGFWFVDALAERAGAVFKFDARFKGEIARASIAGNTVWLLKPQTFMNDSGQSVGACASYYKINPDATLVAHDELSLAAGRVGLKRGGGHGGHNGLRDISRHFGGDFLRVRIGIGRPRHSDKVAAYVLSAAPRTEQEQIETAIAAVIGAIDDVISGNIESAATAIAKLTQ